MMTGSLDISKRTFESLITQMNTPMMIQFVVWLDERISEYKVQGSMNFSTQHMPKWLKTWTENPYNPVAAGKVSVATQVTEHNRITPSIPSVMATLTSSPQVTPSTNLPFPTSLTKFGSLAQYITSPVRIVKQTIPATSTPITVSQTVNLSDGTHGQLVPIDPTETVLDDSKEDVIQSDIGTSPTATTPRIISSTETPRQTDGEQSIATKDKNTVESMEETPIVIIKTEPSEVNSDNVVTLLPGNEPQSDNESSASYHVPSDNTTQKQNYTIQSRPIRSLRPPHRYTTKNSYSAAVAAQKRKRGRPPLQRPPPAETIVHPSQQREHLSSSLGNLASIYPPRSYNDGSSFEETDPSVFAGQLSDESLNISSTSSRTYGTSGFVETGVYASTDEYIQFPVGSESVFDAGQPIKTEFIETEGGDTSMSFDGGSGDASYQISLNEGAMDDASANPDWNVSHVVVSKQKRRRTKLHRPRYSKKLDVTRSLTDESEQVGQTGETGESKKVDATMSWTDETEQVGQTGEVGESKKVSAAALGMRRWRASLKENSILYEEYKRKERERWKKRYAVSGISLDMKTQAAVRSSRNYQKRKAEQKISTSLKPKNPKTKAEIDAKKEYNRMKKKESRDRQNLRIDSLVKSYYYTELNVNEQQKSGDIARTERLDSNSDTEVDEIL